MAPTAGLGLVVFSSYLASCFFQYDVRKYFGSGRGVTA